MGNMKIREVWGPNLDAELFLFNKCLQRFKVLSIDTEFPGFLRNTPRNETETVRYQDLKYNVDRMKVIQLGIALSDNEGNICAAWEFNFSDFDLTKDLHVEVSINLLKSNGLNFEKIRRDGIESGMFVPKFLQILSRHKNLKWVTFHGLYDLAYVLKLFSGNVLPTHIVGFVQMASAYFENIFDIKFMAKYCDRLMGGEIGLSRVAKILSLERSGDVHNAGSDSLLTASVFAKMKKVYQIQERSFEGFLYGISLRIPMLRPKIVISLPIFYHGRPLNPQSQFCVPVQSYVPMYIVKKF